MHFLADSEFGLAFPVVCCFKTTLLLVCTWTIVGALRRASAAVRHHVWAAAILGMLLLPLLEVLLPSWHSSMLGGATAFWNSPHQGETNLAAQTIPTAIVHVTPGSSVLPTWAVVPFLVWALGALFVLFRLTVGLTRLAWLSARATSLFEDDWIRETLTISASLKIGRSVRLLECSEALAMPLTWGTFHPVIVLPAGAVNWPNERRRIVLSHELAHIARHDWLLQICAELARSFHWFNPLVWLAAARLRQESERACDDAVLRSGIAPDVYAGQLLDLARTLESSGRAWSTALAIARPTNLERRFAAMLNPSLDRRQVSSRTKFLIPFLALALLLPLAALRLSAQDRAGKTSGAVHDPSGAAIANATIVMSNHDAKTIDMTTTDREGNFNFAGLPAGSYELQVLKPGFQTYRQTDVSLDAGREFTANINLEVGAITENVMVVPANGGKPMVTEKTNGKPSRLVVGGMVEAAKLVNKVQPIYPENAKSAGVQGTVVLHAVIGRDGKPLSLRVMNGQIDPDLARSAVEAINQWRYTPTLLNKEPIEVDTTINVVYSLNP